MRRTLLSLVFLSCAAPTPNLQLSPTPQETRPGDKLPDPPPTKEQRPEKLGSPQSSKKAKPKWSNASGYAPQYTLTDTTKGLTGDDLREVLVYCSVNASAVPSQDFFGGKNEIGLQLQVGKFTAYGEWKSSSVTAPLISLKKGSSLKLRVYDLDYISNNDPIEFLNIKYEGTFPIEGEGKRVTYSCTALSREDTEKLLAKEIRKAEDELLSLAAISPSETNLSLDTPEDVSDGVERALESMAGLVGWDDPSVTSRAQKMNELVSAYRVAQRDAIAKATLAASALGESFESPGYFTATPSLQCDKSNATTYKKFDTFNNYTSFIKSTSCVLEIKIENKRERPIDSSYFSAGPLSNVVLLTPSASLVETEYVAARSDGALVSRDDFKKIKPGEAASFVFALKSKLLKSKKMTDKTPTLLMLDYSDADGASHTHLARLRDP